MLPIDEIRLNFNPASLAILNWVLAKLHLTWALDAWLALPVVGGTSLSVSWTGTFLVEPK